MRRCLHSGNERLPREIAFEAAKLFRCDDDHFVTPVHRHVLRSFTAERRTNSLKRALASCKSQCPGCRLPRTWRRGFGCFASFDFALLDDRFHETTQLHL